MTLSRRRLLAGLGTVGALGTVTGLGTAAFLTDRETVAGAQRASELELDRSELVPLAFENLQYGESQTQTVCVGLDEGLGWVWLRLCGDSGRLSDLLEAEIAVTFPDGDREEFPGNGDGSLSEAIAALNAIDTSDGADTDTGAIRHEADDQTCLEVTLTVPELDETDSSNAGDLNFLSDGPSLALTLQVNAEGLENNSDPASPWTEACPGGDDPNEPPGPPDDPGNPGGPNR